MQETSPIFEKIIQLLKENEIEYELIEHEPVFTSEQAAKVRGSSLEMGAKAMIFAGDKTPLLIVVPGDKKINTKTFKKAYKIRDLRICSPEEVKEITGLEIGAVPPFGNVIGMPTYVDENLGEKEKIIFNAGSHTKSIKMNPSDYVKLCKPIIGSFNI